MSQTLRQILEAKPAARITEVIARMKKIVAALPPGDGVRAFTALYLAVTQAVDEAAKPGTFEDSRFVRWLDVVFANIYFEALRNALFAAGPVPKAWAPLLEARGRQGVLPLQFALAGMNAHINRDLPVALVRTCEGRQIELRRRSPQQRDFRKINSLLAVVEEQVKAELVTETLRDELRLREQRLRRPPRTRRRRSGRRARRSWLLGELLGQLEVGRAIHRAPAPCTTTDRSASIRAPA